MLGRLVNGTYTRPGFDRTRRAGKQDTNYARKLQTVHERRRIRESPYADLRSAIVREGRGWVRTEHAKVGRDLAEVVQRAC